MATEVTTKATDEMKKVATSCTAKKAGDEMKKVVTNFVECLIKASAVHWNDKKKEDEMNSILSHFIWYQETKVPGIRSDYVHTLQKFISPDILEKFAYFAGYQLEWAWATWEPHVRGEYPRFYIKSVNARSL